MAEEPLVEGEIQDGRALVRDLDAAGVPIVGAFWFYMTDVRRWKLIIVSDRAKSGARDLYVEALKLKSPIDLAKVEFVPPSSAIFKALGSIFNVRGLGSLRVSQSMFNGVYVDDAYVYRLAA